MSQQPPPAETLAVHSLVEPAALKLQHADRHFSALGTAIRQFLDANPLELTVDDADADRWRVVRVAGFPRPPLEWGVLLGDGIHDCRSALDNAVAALCRLAGSEPTVSNDFPILVDLPESDRERKLTRSLRGIPLMLQRPIRDRQPYLLGSARSGHPLAVLQALSDADKHRLVHIGTLAPTEGQYRYRVAAGNSVTEHRLAPSGLTLQTGTEVFRIRIAPDVNAAVDAELGLGLAVGFAATPEDRPVATMAELAEIYRFLWGLIVDINRIFLNFVTLDPPAEVVERAAVARASLSHEHHGERVVYVPSASSETLDLSTGTRTYRMYACPRCGAVGYASVRGQPRLE